MLGVQAYHCEGDFGAQPIHCHEEVEFVAVCRGRGGFQCGRSRHDTGPGRFSVVCPQEPHAGTPLAGDFAVKGLNVSARWLEAAGLDWRFLWHKEALCESAGALPAFWQAYEAVRQNHSLLRQEEALLSLYRAARGEDIRQAFLKPGCSEPRRIEQAVMALRERFTEQISLTELSASVGLTPSYFIRAFRKTVGLSPHAYQNSLRVARAKTLLEHGASIGEVAGEVGFYDQSHLTMHFKRLLGVTPAYIARRAVSSYDSPRARK